MGQDLACKVRFGGKVGDGKAYLEAKEIRFRGDFPLKIALADARGVKAENGELVIKSPAGEARFALGKAAEKWAEKISHPKSVIDKLGVKPGMHVTVLGVDDTSFLSDLKDRGIEPDAKPRTGTDLILLAADAPADLRRLETLKKSLAPGGAIWVVSRKGKETTLKDVDVIAAGRKAGLADTKVCAFSQTHTALRFAQRKSS